MPNDLPPASPPRRLSLRVQIAILGIGATLAAFALVAGPILLRQPAEAEAVAEPPAPPGTFRATPTQWQSLTLEPAVVTVFRAEQNTDGKIATNDDTTTPAYSPFSGRVSKVYAKAGDVVAQGDPLLAIDASEFVQAQNDLVSALAQANTARAQLKLSETAEKRNRDLFQAGGGSLKDWQQSQLDLASANGAQRTAEIALASVRNRLRILGKSDQEIAAIEKTPDSRMAAEVIVHAPIAGTVISRQVGAGQYINSTATGGSTPIFSIGDLSTVWLVANVREADAAQMKVGQPVEVQVLAYPGRVFRATLTYVAPAIDPATRRLPVRAEVDNSDGALKPEMFARFRILTGEEATVLAVPETAVVREGDGARVWVASPEDRTLALRVVRTGPSNDGMVAILDGLKPGETVVTSGALFIDRAGKGG